MSSHALAPNRTEQSTRPLLYAVLVHGVMLVLLTVTLDWQHTPEDIAPGDIIETTVVTDEAVMAEIERLREQLENIE